MGDKVEAHRAHPLPTATMDGSPSYSKPTLVSTLVGVLLIGVLALSMYGTSFEATGAVAGQSCDVSATMTNFHHCNKGDYSIADFCEWERKGTLRSRFCAKQLAVVSMTYAVGLVLVLASILGCMHYFASKVCQICISIALCMLHSISAIASIALAAIWVSAKGDLPDLTFDSTRASVHDVQG